MKEAFIYDKECIYCIDGLTGELGNAGPFEKYGFKEGEIVRFEKINDKKYKIVFVKSPNLIKRLTSCFKRIKNFIKKKDE